VYDISKLGEGDQVIITEYEQDRYGNETKNLAYGRKDHPEDAIFTYTDWAIDKSRWVHRKSHSYVTGMNNTPRYNETYFYYNDFGDLEREERILEGEIFIRVKNEYNEFGQVIRVQEGEPALRERSFVYDEAYSSYVEEERINTGARELVTSALWHQGFGVVINMTDFNGNETRLYYDALGRLKEVYRPGCDSVPSTKYEYYLNAPLSYVHTLSNESCDELSWLETYTYVDGLGRTREVVSEGDDNWVVSGYVTYDAKGNEERRYLPWFSEGFQFVIPGRDVPYTNVTYDSFGRERYVFFSDGIDFTYTEYGALSRRVWDAEDHMPGHHLGTPHDFIEDGQGRLVRVIERLRPSRTDSLQEYFTDYRYDPLNNLTEIRRSFEDKVVTKELRYDLWGRRVEIQDPDAGVIKYEYNVVDDLILMEDARGIEIRYEYDLAGRLIKEEPVGTSYYYDTPQREGQSNLLGRLSWVKDRSGATYFSYDQRGREVLKVKDILGHEYVFATVYDNMDRVVREVYPDGSYVDYGYSDRGLLEQVTGSMGEIITRIIYDPSGKKLEVRYGDEAGTVSFYQYDLRERLKNVLIQQGWEDQPWMDSVVLMERAYFYDRVDNIVRIEDLRDEGDMALPSYILDLRYDDLYRLTQADYLYLEPEPGSIQRITWGYDYLGNMVSWNAEPAEFYTRMLGKIENTRAHALNRAEYNDASVDVSYDASGNMVSMQVVQEDGSTLEHRYTWDELGRLVRAQSLEDGDLIADLEYVYDYRDQRVVKIDHALVYWDTSHADIYPDEAYEVRYAVWDEEERNFSQGQAVKFIFAGGERIGRVVDDGGGGDQYWLGNYVFLYHTDHLGSTTIITNYNTGAIVESTGYLPYGATDEGWDITSGSHANFTADYRFTGKEQDQQLGIYYFGARYYNPYLGRWLSPEPMALHLKTWLIETVSEESIDRYFRRPQNLNMYSYSLNNPLVQIDVDGYHASYIHEKLTIKAIELGGYKFSKEAIELIVKGNIETDSVFSGRTARNTNMHGMRGVVMEGERVRMQTVKEAKEGTAKMYKQTLTEAVNAAKAGKFSQSLKLLGRATHTKQDVPQHQYGVWRGVDEVWDWYTLRIPIHILKDIFLWFGEKEEIIKATQEVIEEFKNSIQEAGGEKLWQKIQKYKTSPPKAQSSP
jgi:RHS repeat-associated protein